MKFITKRLRWLEMAANCRDVLANENRVVLIFLYNRDLQCLIHAPPQIISSFVLSKQTL